MEENKDLEQVSPEEMNAEVLKKDSYTPRPKWQIIAAWIGIAIVGIGFLLYCWQIANGGM
jgi:hypothetical protein